MTSDDEEIDLQRLVEEAAREAYSPRAKKCWPWSHDWTMWQENFPRSNYQRRHCVRCGRTAETSVFRF